MVPREPEALEIIDLADDVGPIALRAPRDDEWVDLGLGLGPVRRRSHDTAPPWPFVVAALASALVALTAVGHR